MSTPPTVFITYGPSGRCPVQAEGTVNGHKFYFRSRGEHWALRVASDTVICPLHDQNSWYHREPYKGVQSFKDADWPERERFAAGYAEEDECLDAIHRMAGLWLAQQTPTTR